MARGYHHGDLRAALIDAAVRLVDDCGHPAVSVREVARRAGVTHTAAYHHFDSREGLLAAVAEHGFVVMTTVLDRAAAGSGEPLRQLELVGLAYVRHALEHAPIYRLMFSAETAHKQRFPSLAAASERMFSVLVDTLARCQAAALVRPGPAVDHALTAWATVHGVATLLLDGQMSYPGLADRDDEGTAASVLAGVYRGLALPMATPPPPRQLPPRRYPTQERG